MENVVIAAYPALSDARSALAELRRIDADGHLDLRGAAVISRATDGSWTVDQEQDEEPEYSGTIGGAVVGGLAGLLAGPLGMLLAGAAGAAFGASADRDDSMEGELVERAFPLLVPPGTVALVADVDEPKPELVSQALTALGGAVHRIPRDEVVAQMAPPPPEA